MKEEPFASALGRRKKTAGCEPAVFLFCGVYLRVWRSRPAACPGWTVQGKRLRRNNCLRFAHAAKRQSPAAGSSPAQRSGDEVHALLGGAF